MYQFKITHKKYGEQTVCIDDADRSLLFKQDEKGNDVHLYKWHLAFSPKAGKLYVFRYLETGVFKVQTLSKFLNGEKRTFFKDGNWLNCCRSNFVARNEIEGIRDPLFDIPEHLKYKLIDPFK